jgi:hypothetical protein
LALPGLWSTALPEDAEIDDELQARLYEAYLLAWEGEPR